MAQCSLKNHSVITIRSITRDDYYARHQLFCALSRAQMGMIHTVDEIDDSPEESYEHIDDFLRNHRGLWLIAQNGAQEIIGEIDITIKPFRRVRHVGALTMGVAPDWQGLGVGSQLMTEALKWASAQGLTRIELFTFASNTRAQALYKKFDFHEEGRRQHYLRHGDGSYEDDLLMARIS